MGFLNWLLGANETPRKSPAELSAAAERGADLLLALSERFRPSFFAALIGETSGDQAKAVTERGTAEALAFALHLTDRIALTRLGNAQRAAFMDAFLPAVQRKVDDTLAPALPGLYNQRTLFYQSCKMPVEGSKENLKGTLFWEFGKLMASPCHYPNPVSPNWNPVAMMQLSLWGMDLMVAIADEFDGAQLFSNRAEVR
jgi:hypothetical protein